MSKDSTTSGDATARSPQTKKPQPQSSTDSEQSMLFAGDFRARTYPWQDDARVWLERGAASGMNSAALLQSLSRASSSSKTCPAFYQVGVLSNRRHLRYRPEISIVKVKLKNGREVWRATGTWTRRAILRPSSLDWKSSGMGSRGRCLTLNTSAWRNGASVCSLLEVLETPQDLLANGQRRWANAEAFAAYLRKYFLSPKACAGILRRAAARGRDLPKTLQDALTAAATMADSGANRESTSSQKKHSGGGNCAGEIDVSTCLTHHGNRQDFDTETFVTHTLRAEGHDASEDGTGRGVPLVVARTGSDIQVTDKLGAISTNVGHSGDVIAFRACGQDGFSPDDLAPPILSSDGGGSGVPTIAFSAKDHGAGAVEDIAPTLRAMGHDESHANGGGQVAIAFQSRIARNGRVQPEEIVPTLNGSDAGATSDMRPLVAFQCQGSNVGEMGALRKSNGNETGGVPFVQSSAAVRRLTPRECARLQGFDDDWNEMLSDSARYKQFGNAVTVNVVEWIGRRIVAAMTR